MTRPALEIGLGGTGQWVLTYLKKNLIETNNGEMPDNVRLLAFDTVVEATAKASGHAGLHGETKKAEVGSVTLEKGREFIYLGGNHLEKEVNAVAEGALPYVGAWFKADTWLKVPSGILAVKHGSGQLRQLSRFSLFMELKQPNLSRVWSHLKSAIDGLERKLNGAQLDIDIVASLAGGTGSGLLIDFALLAKHYAKAMLGIDVQVRGYLVLPRAFTANPDNDMKARAFTVWRELNRFMSVRDDFALPSVIYHPDDKNLQVHNIDKSLFDACYLIDGVREGSQVSGQAEDSVHPIVAEAISVALDDRAGQIYMEHVVNVAKEYVKRPGVPFYSTLSAHSFKVPVYYAQQSFTNNLATNWLDELLKPVRDDPADPSRVTRVDPTSPYDPSKTGRDEALSLLTTPQKFEGYDEEPTLFLGRVADILAEGGVTDIGLVQQYARGSWGGRAWMEDFTQLKDRADMRDVINKVRQVASLRVSSVIKPSKDLKEPTDRFPRRVEGTLDTWVRQQYGFRRAGGGQDRGQFGEALDECGQAQLAIFQRLVNLWLLRSLNTGDKSGRLGYAYDLMDGLVERLSAFVDDTEGFMAEVTRQRQQLNPSLKVQNKRQAARKAMLEYAGKKFPKIMPVIDHPKAHDSQVSYLKAEQAVIDVRKDELLHTAVEDTVRAMLRYSKEVRTELARWIRLLAMGDEATGVDGAYEVLDNRRREIQATQVADKKLQTVHTRVGDLDSWMTKQQREEERRALERLMAGVQWQIEEGPGEFRLHLHIEPEGEPAGELERPTGKGSVETNLRLTQRNIDTLRGYAQRRFTSLPQEMHVAEILSESDVKEVAKDVEAYFDPLMETATSYAAGPAIWSRLVCINQTNEEGEPVLSPRAQQFIRDLNAQLRKDQGQEPDAPLDMTALVRVVESETPHKCTVITTHDLYPDQAFQAWIDYQKQYRENEDMPPYLNHNYQAEVNAAEWEGKLHRRRGIEYRIFHPWVVMLLEHPDRLEQFFLSWILGWVKLEDDGVLKWYELDVPDLSRRYNRAFKLTEPAKSQPSIFQVARAFVLVGEDQTRGASWALDYDLVGARLLDAEREKGAEAWVEKLEHVLKDDGDTELAREDALVKWLRERIAYLNEKQEFTDRLPEGEPANYADAYRDLADVAELMLEEMLASKNEDLERHARRRRDASPSTDTDELLA